jgi:flagellar hook-basal body complex protein FliE
MTSMNSINRPDVQSVVAQMRAMRAAAGGELLADMRGVDAAGAQPSVQGPSGFGVALSSAIAKVNATQLESSAMADSFVRGETTDLVQVMVASQKASVAFQAVTQVRNRLVTAYQDIMNMPI